MKILLLGASGFIGRIAAQVLSSRPEIGELFLVDYNIRDTKKFARSLSPKCRWAMADAGRVNELTRLLKGVDAVASAIGPCAEYEKEILLACAEKGKHAASIGDGTLAPIEKRDLHDAFRREGRAAVSGCGLMPGWTELLSAHFLAGNRKNPEGRPHEPQRYIFCSLDRFGGYAFFRRAVISAGRQEQPPGAAPAGCYFGLEEGQLLGLPPGRASGRFRLLGRTLGIMGRIGRELSAASLFWMRGGMKPPEGTPIAVAGVWRGNGESVPAAAAAVEDPRGILAGVLLAEVTLKLAAGASGAKGLLSLPDVVGRDEAERIARENGAKILAV